YVPSFYRIDYHEDGTIKSRAPAESLIPEKMVVPSYSLPDGPVNRSSILTPETEFANKVLVELGRGCGRSCRFCAAGYVYRPPRAHREPNLVSCVEDALGEGHPIGLLSANVSDTPGIEDLTGLIAGRGGAFSVSSLRADSLTGPLIEHLKKAGQRTLAIAPEAGSERMRRVVNKHLTQEQIIEAVRLIAGIGDFGLRLYFLIGLPTETREDVEEILELVKSIKHHLIKESKTRGKIRQIKLSVNCFVPKPSTPFQWFPMEDVSSLKEKQKWLRKALNREGGVKVSFDVPKWAYLQSLLSAGDRRVGSILLLSHKLNQDWTKVFRFSETNPDFFVHRPRGLNEMLPWDFIDLGIRKEHLIKEYKLALKGIESDVCHVGECDRCGVCTNRP
ncbi:MAG: radical SAM protein, partial [Proteobacteria bacterium]|nr:radical SAM protein [Pseudomonadota bacterium]